MCGAFRPGRGGEPWAIAVQGAGASERVKVFDALAGNEFSSFVALPGLLGGVAVAPGDLDGDG